MDRKQAKVLLSSYRESGKDASDTKFSEALGLLNSDSELKEWYEEDKSFDRQMMGAVKSIHVPANLKSSILASQFVTDGKKKSSSNILNFALWGVAAAMAFALFSITMVRESVEVPTDEQWASVVTNRLNGEFKLGYRSGNYERIEGWLNAMQAPQLTTHLAKNLSTKQPVGCCSFEYSGRKVALLCFMTDEKEWLHLFVVDRDAVRTPDDGQLRFLNQGPWKVARWTDDKNAYFLASDSNTPELATQLY
jgi:hypothetical protein